MRLVPHRPSLWLHVSKRTTQRSRPSAPRREKGADDVSWAVGVALSAPHVRTVRRTGLIVIRPELLVRAEDISGVRPPTRCTWPKCIGIRGTSPSRRRCQSGRAGTPRCRGTPSYFQLREKPTIEETASVSRLDNPVTCCNRRMTATAPNGSAETYHLICLGLRQGASLAIPRFRNG